MSWEAEMAVIGGAVLDRQCAAVAADALAPEMFHDAQLGRVFGKLLDMYWAGEPLDSVTLIKSLPEDGPAILQAARDVPKLEHFGEYVMIVQDEWQWGQVEEAFRTIDLSDASLEDKVGRLRELIDEQERILGSRHEKGLASFREAAQEFIAWLRTREKADEISTGYSALDKAMGGFMRGTVAVLAGRPGGGKTDMAINLAMRMGRRGARVLYFSMEMTNVQLMQRVASSLVGIDSTKVRDKALTDDENAEVEKLLEAFAKADKIHFVQEPRVSVKRIRHYIELVHPDVVVIDHLGLMDRPRIENQNKALGMVSNSLKQLALDRNICVVELVQMNRQIEGRASKKPSLTDLRESGDIEQDADYVMFLLPEDLKDMELEGSASAMSTMYLEKNRHGRPGVFQFSWQPQYHRFSEIDRRYTDGG